MLTANVEGTTQFKSAERTSDSKTSDAKGSGKRPSRLSKALSIEWLGQTVASVCWIVSMFNYGVSSTGDWLQLLAASAWLVANVASLANAEA